MSELRICIVQNSSDGVSETFIRAHADRLRGCVTVLHGVLPCVGTTSMFEDSFRTRLILSGRLPYRTFRGFVRAAAHTEWRLGATTLFRKALKACRPDVVLAEYGKVGVRVMEACHQLNVPLVVYFHGHDAWASGVLRTHQRSYRRLFSLAELILASSSQMKDGLIRMGAPAAKTVHLPYGVDSGQFCGAAPAEADPVFLAVGRFVPKKSPQRTIQAFAKIRKHDHSVRLRMIGDGPLLDECRRLAANYGVESDVTFMGSQPHAVVQREMQQARCFVQHSMQAADGDSEGTPVAVIEAAASGLPVVSTRHAGIPDVVQDGRTGWLVSEGDVTDMARHMRHVALSPQEAARRGRLGRAHVQKHFELEHNIQRLQSLLESTVRGFRSGRLLETPADSESC